MAITYNSKDGTYFGLSTDIKPTVNIDKTSKFNEYDTGKKYIFDGTTWHQFLINQSTATDGDSKLVTRIVDAAPFAYDNINNARRTIDYDPITNKALLRSLYYNYNSRYIYPMQELSGTIVTDYSPNGYNATYTNVRGGKVGATSVIDKSILFTGASYVTLSKTTCSVKGLAAITFAAVIQVTYQGSVKHIILESVADAGTSSRFSVQLTTDNKLSVLARSGLAAQALSSVTSSTPLTEGAHIIHTTIDIVADEMLIYVDGNAISTTGTPNFGTDTVFANTAPTGYILIGAQQDVTGVTITPDYSGTMSYVALWSKKLTAADILKHAQAGGFAT